jgi:hypothetical protein
MRTLNPVNDDWKKFKFGDTNAIISYLASTNNTKDDLSKSQLEFRVKDDNTLVATAPGYLSNIVTNQVDLHTSDLQNLFPDTYELELWVTNADKSVSVYPSDSYEQIVIEPNTMSIKDIRSISKLSLLSLINKLEKQFDQITKGKDGIDGHTPNIGANGNWFINGQDTGVKAEGKPGDSGRDALVPSIGANGHWYIGDQDTGVNAVATKGDQGDPGKPGNDGLTPRIDKVSGNWFIGDQDTGVKAHGQDADVSKFVTTELFNQLRQKVQDNEAALEAMQKSATVEALKEQVSQLSANVTNLTALVKELQEAKSNTPKSAEPAKSDTLASDKPATSDPAKSDTPPASSADSPSTPVSSSTTTPDSTPASADPVASASSESTSDTLVKSDGQ